MYFGLNNALAVFMHIMDRVFLTYLDMFVILFLMKFGFIWAMRMIMLVISE